jgi:hypothetical protein
MTVDPLSRHRTAAIPGGRNDTRAGLSPDPRVQTTPALSAEPYGHFGSPSLAPETGGVAVPMKIPQVLVVAL